MNFLLIFLTFFCFVPQQRGQSIKENEFSNFFGHTLDFSINPCTDFYSFVCNNFKQTYSAPNQTNFYTNNYKLLANELVTLGQEILSHQPIDENDPIALNKAKLAFAACLNSNVSSPELQTIHEFDGMPLVEPSNSPEPNFDWQQIGKMVEKYGINLIFTFQVGQIEQNSSIIGISRDVLLNPSLFHASNPENQDLDVDLAHFACQPTELMPMDIFLRSIARKLLRITSSPKSDDEMLKDLQLVVELMRSLAVGGDYTNFKNDTLQLSTSPTISELQYWTNVQFDDKPPIDWLLYLRAIFTQQRIHPTTKIYLNGINATQIYGVLNLMRATPAKIVKNFALLRLFLFQAPDSDAESLTAFETYYRAKNYKLYPRAEYCTRQVMDVDSTVGLSFAVGWAYKAQFFKAEKLQKIQNILTQIRNVLLTDIIPNLSWMDEESKVGAVEKVQKIQFLIANPDFMDNAADLDLFYSNLTISPWNRYENAKNLRQFKQNYQFSQLDIKTRKFWGKMLFDVNSIYNRPNNNVLIPMSILNRPFFGATDSLADLSRLGAVLGHEITHGFDLNGRKYDPDGFARDWWSNRTREAFMNNSNCFVEQFNAFKVEELNRTVNGEQTFNENLADFGGLKLAYLTFKKYYEKTVNEWTDQLFFLNFASMQCSAESLDYLNSSLSNDVHAPYKFRVNGPLSNFKEFASAFGCRVGDAMNPQRKCEMW